MQSAWAKYVSALLPLNSAQLHNLLTFSEETSYFEERVESV